jgi:hypothetical protein
MKRGLKKEPLQEKLLPLKREAFLVYLYSLRALPKVLLLI